MAKQEEITEGEVVGEKKEKTKAPSRDGKFWIGLVLIILGTVFIANNVFNIDVWDYLWPVIFVVIGIYLISNSFKK
jgi:uncharacterized membrane protein HdeD (DUF308 family)